MPADDGLAFAKQRVGEELQPPRGCNFRIQHAQRPGRRVPRIGKRRQIAGQSLAIQTFERPAVHDDLAPHLDLTPHPGLTAQAGRESRQAAKRQRQGPNRASVLGDVFPGASVPAG